MGTLYAICGPSGAGKTTLLENLRAHGISNLKILTKATDREPRINEVNGLEYNFYSKESFLNKLFAGDFCHIENYNGTLFGIERFVVENLISGSENGVMQTGIYGASKLIDLFPDGIKIVYMYVMHEPHLLSTECLSFKSDCSSELIKRLEQKISERDFGTAESASDVIARRMAFNVVDLASFNGFLRQRRHFITSPQCSTNVIRVLPNLRDMQEKTMQQFLSM